jgi:hypothetical protein
MDPPVRYLKTRNQSTLKREVDDERDVVGARGWVWLGRTWARAPVTARRPSHDFYRGAKEAIPGDLPNAEGQDHVDASFCKCRLGRQRQDEEEPDRDLDLLPQGAGDVWHIKAQNSEEMSMCPEHQTSMEKRQDVVQLRPSKG